MDKFKILPFTVQLIILLFSEKEHLRQKVIDIHDEFVKMQEEDKKKAAVTRGKLPS